MTPEALAAVYGAAFPDSRSWSTEEFAELLASPHSFLVTVQDAFALGRVIADEAELLTIATLPTSQGQGLGRQCLQAFEVAAAKRGAASAFLEVAADNAAAIHLYESTGWHQNGQRKGYYAREGGRSVDALLMGKALT